MPTVFTEVIAAPPVPEPAEKIWTRAECERLDESGFFLGQRYELVQGRLINTMGQKRPHSNALRSMVILLDGIFGPLALQSRVPIDVAPSDNPINEPEPDVVVLKGDFRRI